MPIRNSESGNRRRSDGPMQRKPTNDRKVAIMILSRFCTHYAIEEVKTAAVA